MMNKFSLVNQIYNLLTELSEVNNIKETYKVAWWFYCLGRGTAVKVFLDQLPEIIKYEVRDRKTAALVYSIESLCRDLIKYYD